MSTLVKVQPGRGRSAVKQRRATVRRPSGRRTRPTLLAPPATQSVSQRRPGGVRGPRLINPAQSDGSRRVRSGPSRASGMDAGVRLTDLGLAWAMAVTIALVIAAVVCITTTAARVTAEPQGVGVTAVSGVR